jgi:hypothetical protein
MELKFLISFFSSMIGGLFGQLLQGPEQAPPVKPPKPQVVVEQTLSVPAFVTSIPTGHYAGVSAPCKTLSEARTSAIENAARQILSALNATYAHQYLDRVSGSVRNPKRKVDDRLSKVAKGIVLGVERGIVKSSWSRDSLGRYVYFILVRYPDRLVSEMRRLSKGAKIVCQLVGTENGEIELRLSEVNGVSVTLSSVDITVRKVNRYAGFISYYIMKVPKGSQSSYTEAIGPVRICGESHNIKLKWKRSEKQMYDYILGAEINAIVVLKGHDEIGRLVQTKVDS